MMKTAILGCGNIANTHAQILAEMGLELSICVDVDFVTAEKFAQRWNVGTYTTNFEEVFASDVDVVHVCTPPALHYEMVKNCLNEGKHVFCEKPLCLDDQLARELADIAEANKLVNAVGFNVRYHMACQKMRQIVQSKDFGKTYLVHGSYLQEFNAFPAPYDWRYHEKLAGKMRAVTEIGSHWFDLAQYITGDTIRSLSANFGCFHPHRFLKDGMMYGKGTDGDDVSVASEDAAIIQMGFNNGAIGATVLSEVTQGRTNRLSLEITGENASVWWNSEENNVLHVGRKGEGVQTEIFAFGNGFADTERVLLERVYEDIERGNPSQSPEYPTFRDASYNVMLCNASYESAVDGSKWIACE